MTRCVLLSFFLLASSVAIEAQIGRRLFDKKRKEIVVSNYTLFLNLNDLALEYSTKIESVVDSLLSSGQQKYNTNIFDFRIRAIQTLQHVLYKSDPVIAFYDGWIFGIQMIEYIESPLGAEYLGPFQSTMLVLFRDYLMEWPESFTHLTGDRPDSTEASIRKFALVTPIKDNHLNRTSITDAGASWSGEATIGFKSGVSTLTDAMRNVSDRLNYYSEFSPKLTQWHIEESVRNMIGTDSLSQYLERTVSSLERMSYRIDSLDKMIHSSTDIILTDVERQRKETLYFISSEREAVLERFTLEREMLISQLVEERKAMQEFIHEERTSSFELLGSIISETTNQSFDRVDDMVDRLFFRVLILVAILAIGLILAAAAYKKL